MQNNYGINLEQQLALVETRLEPMVRTRGFSSFGEYLDFVFHDASMEESKALVTRLTTNYTYFWREVEHYNYMREKILPNLRNTLPDKDIRVWSAGCSSGEEAYTAAMVMDEFFGFAKKDWDTTILATDISQPVLQAAREGVYPAERLQKLSPAWKTKYFTRDGNNHYRISDSLRREVLFQPFNLMSRFPFKKKFHIIFCRNVMIYFNPKTTIELLSKFYDSLEVGGYLFVGLSESVDRDNTKFKFADPSIYVK